MKRRFLPQFRFRAVEEGQHGGAEVLQALAAELVEDVAAVAAGVEDAGVVELAEVLRQRRFAEPDQRPAAACVTVRGDRSFSRTHGWIAQEAQHAVYLADYTPARRAPIADFLSKLTQARYVISRDGEVEMTRTVRRPALLERAKLGRFGDLFVAPDTTLVPGVTIGAAAPDWTTLEPFDARRLATGEHTIDIFWTLSARHCDGFAADPVNNCLPAGESLGTSTAFTVVR